MMHFLAALADLSALTYNGRQSIYTVHTASRRQP
jgi:hypothetical protein